MSRLLDDIASREAELLKLNEEIDAKKAQTDEKVERVLKGQDDRIRNIKDFSDDEDHKHSYYKEDMKDNNNDHEYEYVAKRKDESKAIQHHKSPESKESSSKDDPISKLNQESTIRYQKARLRVLQEDLSRASEEYKNLSIKNENISSQVADLKDENVRLSKKLHLSQSLVEKQKLLHASNEAKMQSLETQLSSANTELEKLQKHEKQSSQSTRSKEIRLNRALEELDKTKTTLRELQSNKDGSSVSRKDYEKLLKQNKKLEKQKNEIIQGYKKQLKLIDILKRQKVHMEAAKLLSITEEEFNKTLQFPGH